jgi:outer membrane protein assembly factor BamD (BamD/ComL family)
MNLLRPLAFTFLFLFLLNPTFALDKGLKALNQKKYDKAFAIFSGRLAENPDDVVASYGLSKVLAEKNFVQFDIERAYVHVINTREMYKLLGEKDRKKLSKSDIKEEKILALLQHIDSVAFQSAVLANSSEALEQFIKTHVTSPQIESAETLKSQLDYLTVQKVNTYEAYASYMKKYPGSKKIAEARKKYDLLLYKTLTADGTLQSFKNFVTNYQESPFLEEAISKMEHLEFKSLLTENSLDGYEKFVKDNPDSKYRKWAEDSIYARFTSFPSIKEYETFISKYPDNRNVRDAWEKLYVLFNDSGTPETYEAFKARYPNYREPYQLENDIELSNFGAKMLNTNFLGFEEDQVDAYIALAAPTEQAITVLKIRIKPWLDAHQYQKCINYLTKYQSYFHQKSYRLSSWIDTLVQARDSYEKNKKVMAFTLN